ncbi:hypothetical protein PYCCODRAFT_71254 [Trametes coccinea BRFM310]|uniref:CID domain-containing protein n=1 Tax=Trametes coccinea (strain BRFM310) TaxID=1353009 RepID=A0A1Y2IUL2_TRAC3|nr:hypothetical protein PYCCODRAFT_71254 [Trametes coccinea BRFM310]
MATVEAFESALKDVVGAKRLSQSKMNSLTEIALKCMDHDTQMVSILYRTHKGLSTSAKVWSLYAFDALARAARNRANKSRMTADLTSEKGNCATFLLRIEGILDGLFQDLISTGNDDVKEKAKKIVDIWTKSHTFSAAVLSPLYALLNQAGNDKESDRADTTNVASTEPASAPALPFSQPSTSTQPAATAPTVNVEAVQSTLFALLSKAASAVGSAPPPTPITSQTAPNYNPVPPAAPVPALDANQLALLQQLAAQTAKGNAVPSQPIPVAASVVQSLTTPTAVPVVTPVQGPPQPQPVPYRDDHYGAPVSHRESEHDRFNGPERGFPRDDYNEPRRGFRGGPRDFGRGGRGRGKWGDRDHFRDRSRDLSRDPRPRRSRSRSPAGRYGGPGPRNARPPSPHRAGGYSSYAQRHSQGYGSGPRGRSPARPEDGKDEFGRDLRAESPRDSDSASVPSHQRRSTSPIPPGRGASSATASDRGSVASENTNRSRNYSPYQHTATGPSSYPHTYSSVPSAPAAISLSTASAPSASEQSHIHGAVGLDAFDLTTFNPGLAASWEALAAAWRVTHGSMPTQEQLMQFVLSKTPLPQPQPPGEYAMETTPGPSQQQSQAIQQSPAPAYQPQTHEQDSDRWHTPDGPERQWDGPPQGPRAGWRGRGGGGGGGGGSYGGPGRGQGRGRGDFGRGRGRGDFGRRGIGRGRGDYGRGNDRGAYHAGGGEWQEQESDAVTLSGGGDDYSWQEQQQHQQQQVYSDQGYDHQSPSQLIQPYSAYPHQPQAQSQQDYGAVSQPAHAGGGGEGGGVGRMQKVGDKWVFVRGGAA